MIVVAGRLRVAPSDVAIFANDLRAVADAARREVGCRFFATAVEDPEDGAVLVLEHWDDVASQRAFLEQPTFRAFAQAWGRRMTNELRTFEATAHSSP